LTYYNFFVHPLAPAITTAINSSVPLDHCPPHSKPSHFAPFSVATTPTTIAALIAPSLVPYVKLFYHFAILMVLVCCCC
jgi:hypothetical protein